MFLIAFLNPVFENSFFYVFRKSIPLDGSLEIKRLSVIFCVWLLQMDIIIASGMGVAQARVGSKL